MSSILESTIGHLWLKLCFDRYSLSLKYIFSTYLYIICPPVRDSRLVGRGIRPLWVDAVFRFVAGAPGGRTLDRKIVVDWDEPPSSLLDVAVVVVYEDGTREHVDESRLVLETDGVLVEGHPLGPARVAQVEVEFNETRTPLDGLASWLSGLPGAIREFPEDVRRWRDRR